MKKPKYGEVRYCDCIKGLKELPDNSFDLCFTDPPFNIDLENNINCGKTYKSTRKNKKIYYCDIKEDYVKWCLTWFKEIKRICKRIVIYCGRKNLKMWYTHTNPIDQIIYYLPFNTVITDSAWAGRYQPLLIYETEKNMFLGRNGTHKFDTNILKKTKREDKSNYIHPCPIDKELVKKIITQLKPKSFIDPFLGSGTTAQVCEKLRIPWLGYEIEEAYSIDIEKRLNNVKYIPKQKKILDII